MVLVGLVLLILSARRVLLRFFLLLAQLVVGVAVPLTVRRRRLVVPGVVKVTVSQYRVQSLGLLVKVLPVVTAMTVAQQLPLVAVEEEARVPLGVTVLREVQVVMVVPV